MSPESPDVLNIPKEIDIPNESLVDVFRNTVDNNKDKDALFFKGKFKTYDKLDEEVNRFATSLKKLGVKKGDRIAVSLPNCPQFVVSFFAAQSLGAIIVAFNPMLTPRELSSRIRDCRPKVLLTLDIFFDKVIHLDDDAKVKHVIMASIDDELPPVTKVLYKLITFRKRKAIPEALAYRDVLAQGENKRLKTKINPEEDVAILQYTGGTTGTPKGAMLTHKNLVSQVHVIHYWRSLLETEPEGQYRVGGVLPYSHIFGLTSSFLWPIFEGATLFLIPDPRELLEVMKVVEEHGIHFLNCVPVFFQKIAAHEKVARFDLSSLHLCISGGESLPDETVKAFESKTNCLLVEGYGLTEAAPVTHVNPPSRTHRRVGSIGLLIPNLTAKIVDPETNKEIKDPDGQGELWVKGPTIMKGYWQKEEETKDAIKNGWLRTGDLAARDKHGYYQIKDRLKELIIVSGFKVWPHEIENILNEHPDIHEAVIIPATSDKGTKVKAVLLRKPGGKELTLEDIQAYCKPHLAPYKVPKALEYRDEFPRSMVGKVLRRELINNPT